MFFTPCGSWLLDWLFNQVCLFLYANIHSFFPSSKLYSSYIWLNTKTTPFYKLVHIILFCIFITDLLKYFSRKKKRRKRMYVMRELIRKRLGENPNKHTTQLSQTIWIEHFKEAQIKSDEINAISIQIQLTRICLGIVLNQQSLLTKYKQKFCFMCGSYDKAKRFLNKSQWVSIWKNNNFVIIKVDFYVQF